MDLSNYSDNGLLALHEAIIKALNIDDAISEGMSKEYNVRKFSDWREWANSLEAELIKRDISYPTIPW